MTNVTQSDSLPQPTRRDVRGKKFLYPLHPSCDLSRGSAGARSRVGLDLFLENLLQLARHRREVETVDHAMVGTTQAQHPPRHNRAVVEASRHRLDGADQEIMGGPPSGKSGAKAVSCGVQRLVTMTEPKGSLGMPAHFMRQFGSRWHQAKKRTIPFSTKRGILAIMFDFWSSGSSRLRMSSTRASTSFADYGLLVAVRDLDAAEVGLAEAGRVQASPPAGTRRRAARL